MYTFDLLIATLLQFILYLFSLFFFLLFEINSIDLITQTHVLTLSLLSVAHVAFDAPAPNRSKVMFI